MAGLGGTMLTLAEIAKREDPDGMPALIAETLHQSNPILDDIPWVASNMATGHRSTIRTGLPTVHLRRLDSGVAPSRSTTANITDGMSILEAWSTTDIKNYIGCKTPAAKRALRMSEAEAFVEAMGQKMAELIFYGSVLDDDKEFNGLKVRYDTLSGNVATNVISCNDSTNDNSQTSMWLIGWAPGKIHGIYPPGSVAGLAHKDWGEQVVVNPSGTGYDGERMAAYQDQWMWDGGLVVKDWRYAVRICNIDISDLRAITETQAVTNTGKAILYQMARAIRRIPNLQACRPVFYCTRQVAEAFDVMTTYLANSNITQAKDANGAPSTSFRGVPIKVCDQLLDTETVVS